MDFLEIYWTDVYKTGHKPMLPEGSTLMYSNLTPRSGRLANFPNSTHVVSAGQQKVMRQIKHDWDVNFFQRPVEEIYKFGEDLTEMLMLDKPFDVSHFVELHELGYLPIKVKSIKEGNLIPYKIPMLTIVNTKPLNGVVVDWLVNYLETILSAESWMTPTSATLALQYKKIGLDYVMKTDPESKWFLDYQFHDFSMRGMSGKSSIINSGLGFAFGSRGSDTLPVIPAARKYYDETGVCINSVIASEHAVMCSLTGFFLKTKDGDWEKVGELELETFRYLLKKFPTGILSLVSDTWDLWRVITNYCQQLKSEIMNRDGKLVIRPDSGDPVDIICGELTDNNCHDLTKYYSGASIYDLERELEDCLLDEVREQTPHGECGVCEHTATFKLDGKYYECTIHNIEWNRYDKQYYFIDMYSKADISIKDVVETPQSKGVIELLWDIFGGTETSTGYKKLDSHVGAIYGDSITFDRAKNIFSRLEHKGFASTNIVLGVGSYSLQYVTRDTHGFAQKATYIEIGGDGIEIFKDPVTDNGVKKSAKGLLRVDLVDGEYVLKDSCTWEEEAGGELKVIFEDGKLFNQTTLGECRERFNKHL